MKIKTQSKTILFGRDRREGGRDGRRGRGKEVRIKHKAEVKDRNAGLQKVFKGAFNSFSATDTDAEKNRYIKCCEQLCRESYKPTFLPFWYFRNQDFRTSWKQKHILLNIVLIALQAIKSARLLNRYCSHKHL